MWTYNEHGSALGWALGAGAYRDFCRPTPVPRAGSSVPSRVHRAVLAGAARYTRPTCTRAGRAHDCGLGHGGQCMMMTMCTNLSACVCVWRLCEQGILDRPLDAGYRSVLPARPIRPPARAQLGCACRQQVDSASCPRACRPRDVCLHVACGGVAARADCARGGLGARGGVCGVELSGRSGGSDDVR